MFVHIYWWKSLQTAQSRWSLNAMVGSSLKFEQRCLYKPPTLCCF